MKFKGFVLFVLLWKICLKGQNFVGFLEEKLWTPPPTPYSLGACGYKKERP